MFKQAFLHRIYKNFPFNLQGQLNKPLPFLQKNFISCLICTAREDLNLNNLLTDLAQQTLPKHRFEVVVLDNTSEGHNQTILTYQTSLTLLHIKNNSRQGLMGDLRNETLEHAKGEFILFLDDDTRLQQKDFLEQALNLFQEHNPDIILPLGQGIPLKTNPSYNFLDNFSFATRCCLYKRSVLEEVNGFQGNITSYEDIDLGMRLCFKGKTILKSKDISYQHPPVFFNSFNKPLAIAQSLHQLRSRYPFAIWLLMYGNALRFLPLILFPTIRNRQWFKISLAVLIAPFIRKKDFSFLKAT